MFECMICECTKFPGSNPRCDGIFAFETRYSTQPKITGRRTENGSKKCRTVGRVQFELLNNKWQKHSVHGVHTSSVSRCKGPQCNMRIKTVINCILIIIKRKICMHQLCVHAHESVQNAVARVWNKAAAVCCRSLDGIKWWFRYENTGMNNL